MFQGVTRELKLRIEDMRDAKKREVARESELEVLRQRTVRAEQLVDHLVVEVATLRAHAPSTTATTPAAVGAVAVAGAGVDGGDGVAAEGTTAATGAA